MLTLILLLTAVCFLAATARRWHPQAAFQDLRRRWDPSLVLIAVLLALLIGLRTDYNDTAAYIQGFREAPLLSGFLADPESWDVLRNPLFGSYTSLCRTFTGNYHVYFMLSGLFIAFATVSFLRRVSEEDTFALDLFTYITLGTYMFALAAMKQTIAMAILALAVADLAEGKRLRFAALVLLAGLFHTYAFLALGLLLLTGKPWRWVTWALILGTVAVMLTFEDTITTFLTYADAIGRAASSEMVFSGEGMNLFRVAVYGVVPVASLLFRPILEPQMERRHYLLLHMSIVSFMFMLLASINGANMFGRMARYFELGTVCMFPWTIRHLFNRRSQPLAVGAFVCAFLLFLAYGFWDFDSAYSSITLLEFLRSLI